MAAVLQVIRLLVIISTFTGVSHGQAPPKTCATDQVTVMSQLVTCVVKEHPEYLLTVLTQMDKPQDMETPEFMCSNPGLMADMATCFLQYLEGCMTPDVAKMVEAVMPTRSTVLQGVQFLCEHRQDFDNPCITSHFLNLTNCFSTKLQAFTGITAASKTNLQDTLCRALQVEEQCMADNLRTCPKSVSSSLMSGLLAFFPTQHCNIKGDTVLKYQPY